ncbi:MAG TPA: hypothetical protein VLK25_08415 [Allosphingosinicella sp.]|nr:hypothetical protein [Allosphingosinicella sp.]
MSAALDLRLDALLAELVPPPAPAGLAARIAAAVEELAQEPNLGRARRATVGRDRRGKWRRGLVIGAGAIGLAFSGAVAATLAGVPLPAKVEAVMAKLPLIGHEKSEPAPAPPRPRPVQRAEAPPALAPKPLEADPAQLREARQLQRLATIRHAVAERRAAGLPTPRADRMERRIERRMAWWRQATPEQRQRFLELRRQRQEMRRARIEARRAGLPPPEVVRPYSQEPLPTRRIETGPVYGPADPRTGRRPISPDDQAQRLQEPRMQRLERSRQQRLERQQQVPGTRPVPARIARPAPVRREGLRRPVR